MGNFTLIHDVSVTIVFKPKFCEMRILESQSFVPFVNIHGMLLFKGSIQ